MTWPDYPQPNFPLSGFFWLRTCRSARFAPYYNTRCGELRDTREATPHDRAAKCCRRPTAVHLARQAVCCTLVWQRFARFARRHQLAPKWTFTPECRRQAKISMLIDRRNRRTTRCQGQSARYPLAEGKRADARVGSGHARCGEVWNKKIDRLRGGRDAGVLRNFTSLTSFRASFNEAPCNASLKYLLSKSGISPSAFCLRGGARLHRCIAYIQ